jgi:hypothetical protein
MIKINHDRWRDQQMHSFSTEHNAILPQEKVLLDFIKLCPDSTWNWAGPDTSFKKICNQYASITMDHNANGIILFGPQLNLKTTAELVNLISNAINNKKYAYVGINRYEIIKHDLVFDLPDSITSSIDLIMSHCDSKFVRLHTFDQVDGNHMVAAHPMDCYGLCR